MWNEVAPRYHEKWAGPGVGPFGCTDTMMDMVGVWPGDAVLDVACGTGAVSSKLKARVGDSGTVVGLDHSMVALGIARDRSPDVNFVNADVETMGLRGEFDAVVCQFGLFFFPDAPLALRNMRDVMAERGRLGVVVHGREVPYHTCMIQEATRFIPDYIQPGAPALDRYADREALIRIVEDAGFSAISAGSVMFRYSPGDFDAYWSGYVRYLPGQLREKVRALDRGRAGRFQEAVRRRTIPYTVNGTIHFPWEVLILTAAK